MKRHYDTKHASKLTNLKALFVKTKGVCTEKQTVRTALFFQKYVTKALCIDEITTSVENALKLKA